MTACQDTYRGRVCECPVVNGVRYEGDGYTDCKGKVVAPSSSLLNDKIFFPHAAAPYVRVLPSSGCTAVPVYTSAIGPGRCALNNGGCWSATRGHQTFSACTVCNVTQTQPTSDSDPIIRLLTTCSGR